MAGVFDISVLKREFSGKNSFNRKDLLSFFKKSDPDINKGTFGWRIYHLKQQGLLRAIGRGVYSLSNKVLFHPPDEKELEKIHKQITANYPYLKVCMWNTRWMNDFMVHQSGRFLIIIEVEKDAAESVFYYLRDKGYNNAFLQPDENVMRQYVYQYPETLIVQRLLTKSPLQQLNKMIVPKLEKILVDIFCEQFIFSGFTGELKNIFNTAFEKYDINFSTLLTYAWRRGKKKEIIEFMKANTTIPGNILK